MTVKELIEKLKECDPESPVCWNSRNSDYWFGETIDEEIFPQGWKHDVDEDEFSNIDKFPDKFVAVVLS